MSTVPSIQLAAVHRFQDCILTPDKERDAIVDAIRNRQPHLAKFLLAPYKTSSPRYKPHFEPVVSEVLQIAGLEDPTFLLSMLQWVNPDQFRLTLSGIAISAAERGYFSLDANENDVLAVRILPRLDPAVVKMILWDARHPDFVELISSYHPDVDAGTNWNDIARDATTFMSAIVETKEELLIWSAGMGSLSMVAWLIQEKVKVVEEVLLAAKYQDRHEIVQFLEKRDG